MLRNLLLPHLLQLCRSLISIRQSIRRDTTRRLRVPSRLDTLTLRYIKDKLIEYHSRGYTRASRIVLTRVFRDVISEMDIPDFPLEIGESGASS